MDSMKALTNLRRLLPFAVLAISLAGDTMITVMVIWNTVAKQGNLMVLGICLSTVSIVAFVMQKLSKRFATLIRADPRATFKWTRALSAAVAIGGYFLYEMHPALSVLYVLMALFTVLGVFAQQSLETVFSSLVIHGQISSISASRILQTTIQIGAVLGNALGGLLLSIGGAPAILQAIVVAMLLGSWILGAECFKISAYPSMPAAGEAARATGGAHVTQQRQNSLMNICALVAIGILTIQLSGYNFIVPILFQSIKRWSSFSYGIVDSCAAIGAVIAALPIWGTSKRIAAIAVCAIAVGDMLVANSGVVPVACAAAVFLGWAFNILRITYRGVIFANVRSMEESGEWVSRLTTTYQCGKSALPIVFAFIIERFHQRENGQLLSYVGITVTLLLGGLAAYQFVRFNSRVNADNGMKDKLARDHEHI
jgi:hypothetical protein